MHPRAAHHVFINFTWATALPFADGALSLTACFRPETGRQFNK